MRSGQQRARAAAGVLHLTTEIGGNPDPFPLSWDLSPRAAQSCLPAKGALLWVLLGAGQDKALSQAGGVWLLCPRQQNRGVLSRDEELGVVLAERK